MRVYRRANCPTWYCEYYIEGRRFQRSTRCRDYQAACTVARRFERDAADPVHAAARATSLHDALKLFLEDRAELAAAGKRSHETVRFYEKKAGHLRRILEGKGPLPLAAVTAALVDAYISQRRRETAAENTISKELVTWRATMKLVKRRGLWSGEIDAVFPSGFATEYKPRQRVLTPAELALLLGQLVSDRSAQVAFMVATSAEWGAVVRALRSDVAADRAMVHLRGTKRSSRDRYVPIETAAQKSLLDHALHHAEGTEGRLFLHWASVRRDLHAACDRAGIAHCSPNDLRRTCATWLRLAEVPLELVSPILGHVDTRMVQRVYGRLQPAELAARLRSALHHSGNLPLPLPEDCHAGGTNGTDPAGFLAPGAPAAGPQDPEKTKGHSGVSGVPSVPWGGIEPPTRGFSVPCSTD